MALHKTKEVKVFLLSSPHPRSASVPSLIRSDYSRVPFRCMSLFLWSRRYLFFIFLNWFHSVAFAGFCLCLCSQYTHIQIPWYISHHHRVACGPGGPGPARWCFVLILPASSTAVLGFDSGFGCAFSWGYSWVGMQTTLDVLKPGPGLSRAFFHCTFSL